MKEYVDFPLEFYSEATDPGPAEEQLYDEADTTLRKLAEGHTDITGANIHITKPAEGKETDYAYEATVVLYTRPDNISATEKDGDLLGALKGALRKAERQVRDKRERLREQHRRG